jgi:hypothetical protein
MVEKIKHESPKGKAGLTVIVTTILIILLAVLSVVTIIYVNTVQSKVKYNSDMADKWSTMSEIVNKDAERILSADTRQQQMAMMLQQEILYLNDWIIEMKAYNITNPWIFNQSDIEIVAMEAIAQIDILNDVIRDTYAYNWTAQNGGSVENSYSFMGMENYFVINNYPRYNESLDPDLLKWINWTFFPKIPEILQLDLQNWENEIYFINSSIVVEYGQFTKYYSVIMEFNLNDVIAPYMMMDQVNSYESIAVWYEDSLSSMSSALLLMTISAVVLAFVVSIKGRAYIGISIILGLIVSVIGIYMFVTGVQLYLDANFFASMFGL